MIRQCKTIAWGIDYDNAELGALIAHNQNNMSTQFLTKFNGKMQNFLCQVLTVGKTWIHHYTQKSKQTKEQCLVKVHPRNSPHRLEKDRTMAGSYYVSLLDYFVLALAEKRPNPTCKKCIQGNVSVWTPVQFTRINPM